MMVTISEQDRADLVQALQMRLCVIETGNHILRANDAIQCGKPQLVKALDQSQRQLIARHEALIQRLLIARTV